MKIAQLAQPPEKQQNRQRIPTASATKTIPYDYVITLDIADQPGRVVQKALNISVEGYFVATAIAYSLLPDAPENFGPVSAPDDPERIRTPVTPSAIPRFDASDSIKIFGEPNAKIQLFKNGEIFPGSKTQKLNDQGRLIADGLEYSSGDTAIVKDVTNNLLSPEIRVIVTQVNGGTSVTPQFGARKPFSGSSNFDIVGFLGSEVILSIFKLGKTSPELSKRVTIPKPKNPRKDPDTGLINVNIDKVLEPGDTIVIRDKDKNLSSVFQIQNNILHFNLASIPAKFLAGGFRLNPLVLRRLENDVPIPPEELEEAFQPCGAFPENLSFLYSIIDNGTGRELQSEPIHNIAGLGIANGDRPFRIFPKPIFFEPKSVVLFQVQEILGGPGTLYFVLQGYKVLGTGGVRMTE